MKENVIYISKNVAPASVLKRDWRKQEKTQESHSDTITKSKHNMMIWICMLALEKESSDGIEVHFGIKILEHDECARV